MKNLIYVLLLLTVFYGCVEQKNIRAVSRVEANRTLLDQVFVEGLKLHPCANDTFTITKTRIDTTTVTNIVREVKNDTTYIKTTQYITRRDTVKITLIDKQQTGILNDSILAKVKIIEFQAGQLSAKDGQIKAQGKKEIWLYGIISGLLAFIVIYFGFKIYLSVTKIIPVI